MIPVIDARIVPDLLVFLEVVRQGSITRAAKRLRTVQPNVTARIRKLETELGVTLLVRHARGVTPTREGSDLAEHAQQMADLVANVRNAFAANRFPNRLRIGALETVAAGWLPEIVARLEERPPQLSVSIVTGTSKGLTDQVLGGDLDAAFVSGPVAHPQLIERLAFTDALVVVAPPETDRRNLSAQLAVRVLIQRHGCSYTRYLEAFLRELGVRRLTMTELGSLEGILRSVASGMGITVQPRSLLPKRAPKRRYTLIPLPKKYSEVRVSLIYPAASESSPALARIMTVVADKER
jgi:DNA-binding transcriptional LysR family regulator